MGESELDRIAWIDLVSEAFAWRDHSLFFAEPRLADLARAAFVAGMPISRSRMQSRRDGRDGT